MTDTTERPSLWTAGAQLLAASLLILFQELTFIRWLPAEVRVVAYFPNLVLISAFLGLGVGALRSGRRSLLPWWPAALALTVLAGLGLGRVAFTAEGVSEHLWLLYADLPESAPVVRGIRLPIVLLFVLSTASFVPLGQYVADRIQRFREESTALKGYALDLGGSLVGVVAFAWFSGRGTRPMVWFLCVAVLGAVLAAGRSRAWAGVVAAVGVALALLVGGLERATVYSPYYALSTYAYPGLPDVAVRANGSLHQVAADLIRDVPGQPAQRAQSVIGYHEPYRLLGRPPGKVLILGAGTGNDVAVALDEGAVEVHAVEIDPELVALGRRIHPNRPYDSDRVRVIVDDARSYLQETDETYDLIVFGTLDSMTRLAALSTVRLDNFVYTRDAMDAAAARLAPDGGMAMYFMVSEPFIHDRLVALMAGTFGQLPVLLRRDSQMFNRVYLGGSAFQALSDVPAEASAFYMANELPLVDVPSDDWPFLYLAERAVSPFYLSLMGILAALSVLLVGLARPDLVRSALAGGRMDGEMFLFGAAFLLLETRYVTAMNLLWGATWITSAVVFGAILLTLLVATLLTDVRPLRWGVAAPGLLLALGATWAVEPSVLLATTGAARLGASLLYVGVPVFFAAVCFALRFSTRADAGVAFGWNVLGAVFGGLLEFLGMSVGFAALVLVAGACYLGAFWIKERGASGHGHDPAGPVDSGAPGGGVVAA